MGTINKKLKDISPIAVETEAGKGAVSQAVRKRMGEDRTWTSQT